MSGTRRSPDLAIYRRLLSAAGQFLPPICDLSMLSCLTAPLPLLPPLPLKIAVDSILGSHELPAWLAVFLPAGTGRADPITIMLVAGLIVLLALAKHLIELLFLMLRSYTAEQLILAFRAKRFRHLQRYSLSYHHTAATP